MAAYMIAIVFIMFSQTSNAATISPTIGEMGSGDVDDHSTSTKIVTNKYHSTEQHKAIINTTIQSQLFSGQNINNITKDSTSVEVSENDLSSSATQPYLSVEETTSTVTTDVETSANNEISSTLKPSSSTTKRSFTTSPSITSILTSIKTQSTTSDLTTEFYSETDVTEKQTTYIYSTYVTEKQTTYSLSETVATEKPTTYSRSEAVTTKRPTTYTRGKTDVTKIPTTYISVTASSIEPSTIVENETTKSLYTDNAVTERTSNYTVENVHSTEDSFPNSTLDVVKSTVTTIKPPDISQTVTFSNITTAKISNVSKNKETGTENDTVVLHLALGIPSAFIMLLAVLISVVCLHRYKRRQKAENIDGVQKRPKNSSNPAFMKENMNALAYQFQSRDSKLPSAFKTKFENQGNGFDEIELREENQIAEQNSDKNQTTVEMESNFSPIGKDRSYFTTIVENEQNYDTANTPPLPGKGHKIQNVAHDTSASHYDVLPLRESLPIKKRRQNSIDEIQGLSRTNLYKNPEYDVLPLRTFAHNQLPSDSQDRTFIKTTKQDNNLLDSVQAGNETKKPMETFNFPYEVFSDDLSAPGSKSESETDQDITELEMIGNNAVDKLKRREPASRAPSFVALPRAASGSLRTAL